MKKLLLAMLVCAAATPAMAWGDREQGALAGLAAGIVLGQQQPAYRPAPMYVQPAPVYVQPAPVYVQPAPRYYSPSYPTVRGYYHSSCFNEPVYNAYGENTGYRTVCQ